MATTESASSRYNRDWVQIEDDRKERGMDQRSDERQSREYVTNGVSATGKSSDILDELWEQSHG